MIQDASARFCPFCGKPVAAPDTAFCAYCGRSLLAMQQAPSAASTPATPMPATPSIGAISGPVGYGTAMPTPITAQPPVTPMGASGYPVQPGMGTPAMSAPYGYAGAGMAPAAPASAALSIGRMIGVMLGLVGVLLVLTGGRLYLDVASMYRALGLNFRAYAIASMVSYEFAVLVLIVPLCYWLALLRLRVVSLARLIPEVLAAGVVFIFARALIADLSTLLFLRGILHTATSFYSTRPLLTGAGLLLDVILPVVVGAGIAAGAAVLFTRWGEVRKLSTQTPGRTVRHFTFVLGSFAGFALLDGLLYYSIYTAIFRARGYFTHIIMLNIVNIVIYAVFAVCVVIVASVWMYQALRAVPSAALASPYASPAGAHRTSTVPVPAPPSPPSGAPAAAPQHDPVRQTPLTETQAAAIAEPELRKIQEQSYPGYQFGPVALRSDERRWWVFITVSERLIAESHIPGGPVVYVDKLDGHLWTKDEVIAYNQSH